MGFFDRPVRPKRINVLDIRDRNSNAIISYTATYADKSTTNINKSVKDLRNSSYFVSEYLEYPDIIKVEYIGRVYIGFLKSDIRMIFLITLSDHTMDLVQEKDGTQRCVDLLAKAMGEDTAERTTEGTAEEATEETSTGKRTEYRDTKEDIDIPIEILPNLYSLSLSNVSIKLAKYYKDGVKTGETVYVKCRVNYSLNGRKEGKRYIIFTSYDDKDSVIEIRGDYDKYHFTAAGHEFVEIFFPDYDKYPIKKISISVKEV